MASSCSPVRSCKYAIPDKLLRFLQISRASSNNTLQDDKNGVTRLGSNSASNEMYFSFTSSCHLSAWSRFRVRNSNCESGSELGYAVMVLEDVQFLDIQMESLY